MALSAMRESRIPRIAPVSAQMIMNYIDEKVFARRDHTDTPRRLRSGAASPPCFYHGVLNIPIRRMIA